MRVTVKLFAILRDLAGAGEVAIELPDGATAGAAGEALCERFPVLRPHAARWAYAVNQTYARRDATLAPGDELAILPPVSGG